MNRINSILARGIPLVLFGLSVFLMLKSLSDRVYDSDLFWNLASGRAMVESKIFLRTDIFSHTFLGAEWINFEWLSQLIFIGIFKIAGVWGLYGTKILLSLSAVSLIGILCYQVGARRGWLLVLIWVGFHLVRPRLLMRPELFTLNLLALLLFLILKIREKGLSSPWRYPTLFFCLSVLWTNLHGGFVYGLVCLMLFALGAWWAGEKKETVRVYQKAFLLAGLGSLLNPYGVKLGIIFIKHFLYLKKGPGLIREWDPTTWGNYPLFWYLFIFTGIVMVWGFLKGPRRLRFWIIPLLFFMVWGSKHYRNVGLFAFLAMPFLAEGLLALKERYQKLFSHVGWERMGWILSLIFIGINANLLAKPIPGVWLRRELFPMKACQFIEKNQIKGTLFNTYSFGGYIEWVLGPERKVFMDGRYLFYPLLIEISKINQNLVLDNKQNSWEPFLNRYGIDYAIVNYHSNLTYDPQSVGKLPFPFHMRNFMFPRSKWGLVYWDDAALVFLKRIKKRKELLEQHEYRSLWPYNLDQMQYLLEKGALKKEVVREELNRHKQNVGFTVIGQIMEGILRNFQEPDTAL